MIRLRYCGAATMFLAAVAFWLIAEACSPKLVDAVELAAYSGGYDQWCVTPNTDDGPVCNECLSNGNGNYIKCTSSGWDVMPAYQQGMHPASHYQFDETACGLDAVTYSDSDCNGSTLGVPVPCGRNFTAATWLGFSWEVSCP